MENAVSAAYTGTNGQCVENDFEKKVITNPRTQTRNPQPSPTQHTNQNPNTTPNWYANLRKSGTFSSRLLLQEYGYLSIPKRPVS